MSEKATSFAKKAEESPYIYDMTGFALVSLAFSAMENNNHMKCIEERLESIAFNLDNIETVLRGIRENG